MTTVFFGLIFKPNELHADTKMVHKALQTHLQNVQRYHSRPHRAAPLTDEEETFFLEKVVLRTLKNTARCPISYVDTA